MAPPRRHSRTCSPLAPVVLALQIEKALQDTRDVLVPLACKHVEEVLPYADEASRKVLLARRDRMRNQSATSAKLYRMMWQLGYAVCSVRKQRARAQAEEEERARAQAEEEERVRVQLVLALAARAKRFTRFHGPPERRAWQARMDRLMTYALRPDTSAEEFRAEMRVLRRGIQAVEEVDDLCSPAHTPPRHDAD